MTAISFVACALMLCAHMIHQFPVAKPTVSRDNRRGQVQSTRRKGCEALINHRPRPAPFVAAWGASADRVGPPHGTVHRDHQFPVPNDHHQ